MGESVFYYLITPVSSDHKVSDYKLSDTDYNFPDIVMGAVIH